MAGTTDFMAQVFDMNIHEIRHAERVEIISPYVFGQAKV